MDNENETVENPLEGICQQGLNEKLDRTSPETDDILKVVTADEPYVRQEFESEAAARAFYNAYATRVGSIIRVSKLSRSRHYGSAIGRAFVCNKEGFRMPDKREKIMKQRAETRVGCRAMILVRKVSSGKWVVTKFVKEHTHPLMPGKGRRDCIYDQYPNEHNRIQELMQQLAIEKKTFRADLRANRGAQRESVKEDTTHGRQCSGNGEQRAAQLCIVLALAFHTFLI